MFHKIRLECSDVAIVTTELGTTCRKESLDKIFISHGFVIKMLRR